MTVLRVTAAMLRALRTALSLTQEELAAAIGVTVSTVNRWEKSKAVPSVLACRALIEYARVHRVAHLLAPPPAPAPPPPSGRAQ